MMLLGPYLAYVAAVTALMILPGPNVALIVGTSLDRGLRAGLQTVAGTTAAMAAQLACVSLGLATAMAAASPVAATLRWVGVAYLFGLGVRALLTRPEALPLRSRPVASRVTLLRGFVVSAANPKTLLFYGALLPQFVDPGRAPGLQVLVLAATALLVALIVDTGWALLATRLKGLLTLRPRFRQRLQGGCLIGAAGGLALANRTA